MRREPREEPEADRRGAASPSGQRVFAPGGEWLYWKFYCGPGAADLLLRELVGPLRALHDERMPGGPWFFIRYADPETHLRVRFCGGAEARRAREEQAAVLARPFVERGAIHRVALDTYVRETERYGGGRGIELAEEWFGHDSAAALRVLEAVEAAGDEGLRWKAAAMGFDRLLADFGLDHSGRERVVSGAREAFGREFGVGPAVRRGLARRLRAERSGLLALVEGPTDGPLAELDGVLRDRSASTVEIVKEFRRLEEAGNLECPLDELLRSLTHMMANRLLPASARAQELVIHDFLSRTYRSLAARGSARGRGAA